MTVKKDSTKKPLSLKQKTVRLGAATVLAVSGVAAYQAIAATANLRIVANLIRAIELTMQTTMDFGTLAMTLDRPGQATIDPQVNRLFIDDTGSLSLAGGEPQAGRLLLRGAELPMAVSIASSTIKLTNGTNTVVVGDFNLMSAQGGLKMTFTPTQNISAFSIPVGATITTRTGQVTGSYVGTAQIFASYQ